ncbi:DUF6161 domain-containing protein [Sideroxydans sp.]
MSKTAYFSANFGEEGGLHEWKTHEEIINWINQLQQQWSWLSGQGQNSTNQAWQKIHSSTSAIINHLQQSINFRNQNNIAHADNQFTAARTALENLIRQFPWLLPNSAKRKFVEEVRDTRHILEAGIIVASWMGIEISGAPIRFIINALLQEGLFERGIKDRYKTEASSLKRLAGEVQTALTHYQEEERTQTNRFNELHEVFIQQQNSQQEEFNNNQSTRSAEWDKQRDSSEKELENIKNTYDQHMALAAPVEYWESKRKKHLTLSQISGASVILGMIATGVFISSTMNSISLALKPNISGTVDAATSSVPATSTISKISASLLTSWDVAAFIMVAVLCFWVLRLLVRIFLSNMHLENDAAERVTMAKTYLSLIRNDSLSKEGNIDTVLAALFRPTGDGIVKDEGLPPSMMEFLTKLR